jgi:hypothetical protein
MPLLAYLYRVILLVVNMVLLILILVVRMVLMVAQIVEVMMVLMVMVMLNIPYNYLLGIELQLKTDLGSTIQTPKLVNQYR